MHISNKSNVKTQIYIALQNAGFPTMVLESEVDGANATSRLRIEVIIIIIIIMNMIIIIIIIIIITIMNIMNIVIIIIIMNMIIIIVVIIREAPLRITSPLFRHCPFGGGLNPCQDGLGYLCSEN